MIYDRSDEGANMKTKGQVETRFYAERRRERRGREEFEEEQGEGKVEQEGEKAKKDAVVLALVAATTLVAVYSTRRTVGFMVIW